VARVKKPRGIVVDSKHLKMRECLRCGDDFMSTWAGHRICDGCSRLAPLEGGPKKVYRLKVTRDR